MSDEVPAAVVTPTLAPAPQGFHKPIAGAPAPVPAADVSAAAKPASGTSADQTVTPAADVAKQAPAAGEKAADATPAPKRLITDPDAKAPEVVPAKAEEPKPGDWKLEAPKDSVVSAQEFTALEAEAKKLGLPKEQAQAIAVFRDAQAKAEITRTNDLWFDQSMADTEIGGDKMPATKANVQQALAAWATPAERAAIANSPFANNPLFLRILNRASQALPKEDAVGRGTPTPKSGPQMPTNPTEAANLLYPQFRR